MTPKQFEAALDALGWSHEQAAEELGVAGRGRITDWANGYRPVPDYIAVSVRTRLELERLKARMASAAKGIASLRDNLPHIPKPSSIDPGGGGDDAG